MLYYHSNNNSTKLYYKCQFAFAPHVLVNKDFKSIPEGSLILVVTDLKYRDQTDIWKLVSYDSLSSFKNSNYKIDLIKRKK